MEFRKKLVQAFRGVRSTEAQPGTSVAPTAKAVQAQAWIVDARCRELVACAEKHRSYATEGVALYPGGILVATNGKILVIRTLLGVDEIVDTQLEITDAMFAAWPKPLAVLPPACLAEIPRKAPKGVEAIVLRLEDVGGKNPQAVIEERLTCTTRRYSLMDGAFPDISDVVRPMFKSGDAVSEIGIDSSLLERVRKALGVTDSRVTLAFHGRAGAIAVYGPSKPRHDFGLVMPVTV